MKFSPKSLISPITPWKRWVLPLCVAVALSVSTVPQGHATDLPSGVLNYLRHKDSQVKVRFDGVVVFSNGETYVPVIPQDPSLNPDSQQVVATYPDKAAYPDLIQFDNNFFLMRLIQTASGRLTFPKMAEYPLQLKEGLLPQDFVLPDNLFIPVELKVILGSLPYNPGTKPPDVVPHSVKNGPPGNSPLPETVYQLKSAVRLTYVFDLTEQKLIGIDTITGRKQGDVPLDCVPSSIKLSGDGKLLFAPCLSTNELVVIDTGSNLIKTRVAVGQRPDAVLYLDNTHELLVSNRFSPFLSLLNSEELLGGQKIDLPGNGGAMAVVPGGKSQQIVVADAFKSQVYLVDMTSRAVIRTLKAVSDISAVRAFRDENGHVTVWALSRTSGQLALIDAEKDTILKTINVGAKPVDMADYDDKLYVVSAGASQVDVVDRPTQSVVATIPLEADSFPSGIVTMADEKRAFVVTAAANNLVVINLAGNELENTFPVEFRANMIATVPDKKDFVPEPASKVAPTSPTTTDSSAKNAAKTPVKQEEKHHGLFGKHESSLAPKSRQSVAQPKTGQAASSVQAQAVMPSKTQGNQSSNQATTSNNGNNTVPTVLPNPSGNTSGSPLNVESPGRFKLFLGGSQKSKPSLLSPDSSLPQATKAGVRLLNPTAPEPSSPTDQQQPPTDTPSMLMMAPDVQK